MTDDVRLMLKNFELEARFPGEKTSPGAVGFMAGQVKVEAAMFASYDWSGRTIKNHRAQVREFHGFRESTVGDEGKLVDWLADKICPVEMSRDQLRGALLARCREDRIEPPKTTRIERVLSAAEAMFERNFTTMTLGHLSFESVGKPEELSPIRLLPRPLAHRTRKTALPSRRGRLRPAGARSCRN
ncbi:DUF4158 domain-containing protein [Microbispora bryophytorum]|uniref:DUF4158 domain-containing protein n=1 Tax=Microbispora bryophytorum TaxID=1460882 RepID=UPI0033CED720